MKKNAGFTLIEIVVSLLIFSVVMIVGLSFFVGSRRDVQKSKREDYAMQLSKDSAEFYNARSYPGIPVSSSSLFSMGGIDFQRFFSANEFYITASYGGSPPSYIGSVPYKILSVTVTWFSPAEHRMFLRTIKGEDE